jgi:endonuclease/exonuclease/phosphatase family metal-dependent hydrolase
MSARLVAWNVHHCCGLDLRVMPGRIVDLIGALSPDVVALSELDVDHVRSQRLDQPAWIASRLGMHVVFAEALDGYGHALFSRFEPSSAEVVPLAHTPLTEPRMAIDAVLETPERPLRVVATHLGLTDTDRAMQAGEIVARARPSDTPVVVLGDLNAGPGEVGYVEIVAASFTDPLADRRVGARCTWPSLLAFRPLDHVLLGPGLSSRRATVLKQGAARFASDHRPVVVDIDRHIIDRHIDC